jgi:cyclopropane fatty-acyl-phospholipid synthase-like methyltransferase
MSADRRIFAASTARNRGPILAVLRRVLPENSKVLEIASGAGEHAVLIAKAMPTLDWQPSDPDRQARDSIASWAAHESLTNVRPPLAIDVRDETWGVEDRAPFDAIVSINMIHIAPWSAALGLLKGAERLLRAGGLLFLYGPFMREGRHTAPSNAAFDASLKTRNAEWGVRDLSEVRIAAERHSLQLREIVEMPANNLSVIFAKSGESILVV